MGFWE
jgi:Atypical Arm repeat